MKSGARAEVKTGATARVRPGVKYAIAFMLLGGNDKYLLGANVLIHSIKRYHQNLNVDFVCFTDRPITSPHEFTRVLKVKPISFPTNVIMKWKKKRAHYEKWIDKCFTKLYAFTLTEYEKVLFLDVDMLCVGPGLERVFQLPTPAAVFVPSEGDGLFTGHTLSKSQVREVLEHGYGASAASFLISPSKEDFDAMIKRARETVARHKYYYESKTSYAGPDEQLITSYLGEKYTWTAISRQYNCLPWKVLQIQNKFGGVCILHYPVTKPWAEGKEALDPETGRVWDDIKVWRKYRDEYLKGK